ncbi:MAG: hypothetical protein ACFFCS_14590 [Candidatus Hodarchaeota archaeon]
MMSLRTKPEFLKKRIIITLVLTMTVILPVFSTGLVSRSCLCLEFVLNSKSGIHPNANNDTWYRAWGLNGTDMGKSVWVNGSSVYTCGTTLSYGVNGSFFLCKWYGNGSLEWSQIFDGPNADSALSIWGNGSVLYTCGYTTSFGAGDRDLLLVKWNVNGTQLWNRTWGGLYRDEGHAVWCDGATSNVFTCGYTRSFGAGDQDLLVVAWHSNGTQLWNRTWGGANLDAGRAIFGNGTSVYACGYSETFGSGSSDLVLVKWNTSGNQVWNRTWGGVNGEIGYGITCSEDAIYTSGYTSSYGAGDRDLLIVKWSGNGTEIWNRTFGDVGVEEGYDICLGGVNSSNIYSCGWTTSNAWGLNDMLLTKWNASTGDLAWNVTWGGSGIEAAYDVCYNGTHMYTCGLTTSVGNGSNDAILVKWDENGNTDFLPRDDQNGHPESPPGFPAQVIILICSVTAAGILSAFIIVKYRNSRREKEELVPIAPTEETSISEEGYVAPTPAIEEIVEEDISISKEKFTCGMHNGLVDGHIFACPRCGMIYCQACAESVIGSSNECKSCGSTLQER